MNLFFWFTRVTITCNVNHSVDGEINEEELNQKANDPPSAEMKSRPQFEVKLTKGTQTTRFACAFVQDAADLPEDGPSKLYTTNNYDSFELIYSFLCSLDDVFTIDELAIYEGEHNEQTYAVAGDILDGVTKFLIIT